MVQFYYRISVFILGVVLGILLGKYCMKDIKHVNLSTNQPYNLWFQVNRLKRRHLIWDTLRYNNSIKSVIESDFLFKNLSISCLIILKNEKNKRPIENTWTKGCNDVIFLKIPKRKTIPTKRNNEDSSWVALCKVLTTIENSDWVFIVNDYTFVIMENLRYYLAPLNANDKYYLGHTLKFWSTVFNSKEGGIVLSKGTLNAFNNFVKTSNCSAFSYWNREDFYLGKTLVTLGIQPNDTRDYRGLSRFHPFNLYALIFKNENYKTTNVFPFKCCSKHSISFQAIDGDKMYTYYYLIYTVQIFTYGTLGNVPNLQEHDDQVWKDFLKERNIFNDNIRSDEYYKVWENVIDDPSSFAANMKRELDVSEEV